MCYFAAFLNLKDKKVLVVGGGKIAGDKISHLLGFTRDITVVSPKIDKRVEEFIEKYSLVYINREYKDDDLKDFFIVIVAADDLNLQEKIFKEG